MGGEELDVILQIPRTVRPVPVPASGASLQLTQTAACVLGWSLRETTGAAPATVEIYDGRDANGTPIAMIGLPVSGTDSKWLGPYGVRAQTGIYVKVVSGTVHGALYLSMAGQ